MRIMRTPGEVIKALGGDRAIAHVLGITPSAVRQWKVYNKLPIYLRGELMSLAAERGLYLSHELFPPLGKRGPKPGGRRRAKEAEADSSGGLGQDIAEPGGGGNAGTQDGRERDADE